MQTVRSTWVTPDFVQPPDGSWMSLLAPAYLAERAKLISAQTRRSKHEGRKTRHAGRHENRLCALPEQPEYGTPSHISMWMRMATRSP
ncbi:MAG: hypothetical protein A3E79_08405 [Burkholderiales bacterium RIFCSPHIGHO2_12_FULL_61_11]|nr:MAG: hypothetical protein A3E79_08405 [Burkholderiales bacterium RIFCSPHIGHO2_12_FULL_61_11]